VERYRRQRFERPHFSLSQLPDRDRKRGFASPADVPAESISWLLEDFTLRGVAILIEDLNADQSILGGKPPFPDEFFLRSDLDRTFRTYLNDSAG
jgi:hypothetical protein